MPEQPPKEPAGKPEQVVPPGEDLHQWVCRYCDRLFETAEEVIVHQAARHPGVGLRLVTDVDE